MLWFTLVYEGDKANTALSKTYQKNILKKLKGCCSEQWSETIRVRFWRTGGHKNSCEYSPPWKETFSGSHLFAFLRRERKKPSRFLWFDSTLTYCKLHNFSGTFVFHVRCRLFLWKILKYEVCNSLGSYLYILLKIHQTSYFNSDSITDRSNIIKKPQY